MNSIRRKISVLLLVCLVGTFYSTPIFATQATPAPSQSEASLPKAPSIVSESAIVMEASTGMIIYSKNMNDRHYPASITKIMTTLLAVENCSLSEILTFSRDAIFSIDAGSTHVGSDVGENMTLEDALYCVMLESANEVSNAVGEHVGGSLSGFAEMMTARAKELGATNTNFMNASGLHNDDHYTSAYDMALITQAAMSNSTFRKITATKRYDVAPTNKQAETRYLRNHHQMLYAYRYPQYAYEYTIGGKTGYTSKAGNTLVTIANKDGLELICVVMKSKSAAQPENQYTDTKALLDYGYENYATHTVDSTTSIPTLNDDLLFTRYHSLFDESTSPFRIEGDNTVVLPNTATISDVTTTIDYLSDVILQPGDNVIGTITYTLSDTIVGSSKIIYTEQGNNRLVTSTHVVEQDSSRPVESLMTNQPFVLLGIILIIIVLLFISLVLLKRYRIQKRRKYRNRNRSFANRNRY